MTGPENMRHYNNELLAIHYRPGRNPRHVHPEITETEAIAYDLAFELGQKALEEGNPPVGAILLVNDGEHVFGAKTHDKTSRKIGGHAELDAYADAHAIVGDDLSTSVLISTAVPCTTCAPPYAEGKIGKIIASAPRRYIWQLSGIMRPRKINMHELLADGATDTITVLNYQLERSLAQFALYGRQIGHPLPSNLDPFLLPFVEQAYAA